MSRIKLILAELRKKRGITQKDLAEYLGVSFQAVSKWENRAALPDIALLPVLSEYFNVSVDELLGLKPLKNGEHISRGTDRKEHWDNKLGYLKATRVGLWNDDYMEFLVKTVWQINEPIDIIDFGCGYGYLGTMLLPILPEGSSYTGVDISEVLINEAKQLFKDSEYRTEFTVTDLNSFQAEGKYDMAICQALLRHLPNPKQILKKMVEAVSPGGRVVTIEVNREFESGGFCVKGLDYDFSSEASALRKLWKKELLTEGRDHRIGMKLPFYMQELGLRNIGIRVSDRVNFLNPEEEKADFDCRMDALMAANDWNRTLSPDETEKIIALFMNRGLSKSEAEEYVQADLETGRYLVNNRGNIFLTKALCLLVSYGTK